MRLVARQLCLAMTMLFTVASSTHAEDAKSLPIGAPIADGGLKIGARTWKLPPGDWKLAGRHLREVRLNEIQSGAEVIEVLSAQARDGRLEAGLPAIATQDVAALTAAPEALIQWARAYRGAVAAALGKTSGTLQVPPLPSR